LKVQLWKDFESLFSADSCYSGHKEESMVKLGKIRQGYCFPEGMMFRRTNDLWFYF
jgi:hypothetical protein